MGYFQSTRGYFGVMVTCFGPLGFQGKAKSPKEPRTQDKRTQPSRAEPAPPLPTTCRCQLLGPGTERTWIWILIGIWMGTEIGIGIWSGVWSGIGIGTSFGSGLGLGLAFEVGSVGPPSHPQRVWGCTA